MHALERRKHYCSNRGRHEPHWCKVEECFNRLTVRVQVLSLFRRGVKRARELWSVSGSVDWSKGLRLDSHWPRSAALLLRTVLVDLNSGNLKTTQQNYAAPHFFTSITTFFYCSSQRLGFSCMLFVEMEARVLFLACLTPLSCQRTVLQYKPTLSRRWSRVSVHKKYFSST